MSVRLAGELGMRPLVAHCHAGLANLCRRTGKHDEAQDHQNCAMATYRETGMAYWLGKLENDLK